MEKKIRLMRKILTWVSSVGVIAAFAINGKYAVATGLAIGTVIGTSLRKKKPEPDEMDLQTDLFSTYIASAIVIFFLVFMLARHDEPAFLANPYFQVLMVWLAAWAGSTFILKKVWK